MHLQHVTFNVRDMNNSIQFYETMAGLTVARREQAGPGEIAFLTNGEGETEIEFVCMPQGQKFEGKGMFICFRTTEAELVRMHQLAEDKGLKPSPIQNPGDSTRYFYVYDPDQVSVQLRSYPD